MPHSWPIATPDRELSTRLVAREGLAQAGLSKENGGKNSMRGVTGRRFKGPAALSANTKSPQEGPKASEIHHGAEPAGIITRWMTTGDMAPRYCSVGKRRRHFVCFWRWEMFWINRLRCMQIRFCG